MNNEKQEKTNKIILICGISMTTVTLLVIIIFACFTPKAVDPKLLGPRKKITYMGSRQFAQLPEDEKINYMKEMGYSDKMFLQVTNKERAAVIKNTREIRRKKTREEINNFFAMSNDEQNKKIDEIIAIVNKRKEAQKKTNKASENKSNNKRKSGNSNAWKQGFFEKTDSTTRAKILEFVRRFKEREKK